MDGLTQISNQPIKWKQVDAYRHAHMVKNSVLKFSHSTSMWKKGPIGAKLDCGPVMERGVCAKVKTNSLLAWRELWHCEALLSRPR